MDSKLQNGLKALKDDLVRLAGTSLNMIIGFDGFVDEIIHVVDTRQDFENYKRLGTIDAFGTRISRAAGLSANFEFVPVQTKLGGNGPILSNALIEYGVDLTYIGALGETSIHPVFLPMSERCRVLSVCDPGHTDALEFQDGKLMLGKHSTLRNITWERIKEKTGGAQGFADMLQNVGLLGMENWTMLPYMSEIWEGVISEVFPLLPSGGVKPLVFFDLADPEKRTKQDIAHAMKLIRRFEEKFRVILGLNEKEAYEIAEVLGVPVGDLNSTVSGIYEKLDIYCLAVHPTKEAVACSGGEYFHTEGPYCENPVLTTGAGDNFNAGFCMAQALELDVQASLMLGVCTSGFYVRNGRSPRMSEVIEFIESWAENIRY